MNKLLNWAAGRNWDLYGCRRNWLLYMGILFQCGATCNLADPSVYPLHEINAMLIEPLEETEVDEVINSLCAKASYVSPFKICDTTIAENLEMTSDECAWYCAKGQYHGANYRPSHTFATKHREIMAITPWDPEIECRAQFVDRCHDLTKLWLDENRFDKNRNSARTRKNKAKPGYNPKGGRPSKYTDDDRVKCIELRETGMSYRNIAKQLGCSVRTVQRMLQD